MDRTQCSPAPPVAAGEEPTQQSLPMPTPAAPLVPAPRDSHASTRLVLSRGPQAGTAIPVPAGSTALGRSRDCDVVLDSPTVSRYHAEIHRDGLGYTIVDVGSLNGTYLNRRPVDRAPLTDGDELWIGTFRFTFHTH